MKDTWRSQLKKAEVKGVIHKLTQKSVKLSWYGPKWRFLYITPWRIEHITNTIARRIKKQNKRREASNKRDRKIKEAQTKAFTDAIFKLEEVI